MNVILFDMDGVLIDSIHAWYTTFNNAYAHFESNTISLEEFSANVWAHDFKKTRPKYFSAAKKEVQSYFQTLQPLLVSLLKKDQAVISHLQSLNQYRLAIATNTQTPLAKEMLKKVGILDFFELVVGSDQVEHAKPKPDVILEAMKQLGVTSEETVYVGDTRWDEIAARAAKVPFISYRRNSTHSIDALNEIPKKIKELS